MDALSAPDASAPPAPEHHGHHPGGGALAPLALAALGVVYGDIGTSPLYAIRECFALDHAL